MMSKACIALCLVAVYLLACTSGISAARTLKQGCGTHTIAPGDTFWKISQQKGLTVEAIQAANPSLKPEALQIGQTIQLPCPAGGANPVMPTNPITGTLPVNPTNSGVGGPGVGGPGATNPGISGPGVSGPGVGGPGVSGPGVDGPADGGPGVSGPGVSGPGVSGPGVGGPGAGGCSHTIAAGDTLWALSQKRGTTVAQLQALNPGVVPEALQVGQVIKVC